MEDPLSCAGGADLKVRRCGEERVVVVVLAVRFGLSGQRERLDADDRAAAGEDEEEGCGQEVEPERQTLLVDGFPAAVATDHHHDEADDDQHAVVVEPLAGLLRRQGDDGLGRVGGLHRSPSVVGVREHTNLSINSIKSQCGNGLWYNHSCIQASVV